MVSSARRNGRLSIAIFFRQLNKRSMTQMKNFLKHPFLVFLLMPACLQAQTGKPASNGSVQRDFLVRSLVRIADPVLTALSKNELKKKMPVEAKQNDRQNYTHLEAFGRLLAGIAPWLELGADSSAEG